MSHAPVTDIQSLYDRIGSPKQVAAFFGEKPNTIANWRARGALPARLMLKHTALLASHGINAPACLWGMKQPERAA